MKRIVILALLLVLVFCMAGCVKEPVIKVGMTQEEYKAYEVLSCFPYVFLKDEDYYYVGERVTNDFEEGKLEKVTAIKAFRPKKDAIMQVKNGMTVVELVKVMGLPESTSGSGVIHLNYPIGDDGKHYYSIGLSITELGKPDMSVGNIFLVNK